MSLAASDVELETRERNDNGPGETAAALLIPYVKGRWMHRQAPRREGRPH